MEDPFEAGLQLAAIDMINWMVVLVSGDTLPIVSGFDEAVDPVEDLYEAATIPCGTTEAGYYEIDKT